MKVKELVALLQEQDQELEVLSGDNDCWYYDICCVETGKVVEGREKESGELCVLLKANEYG